MPSTRRGGDPGLGPRLLLVAALALLQSLLLPRGAAALPIEGTISIAPGVEPPSTKVILNGGAHVAFTAADGSFQFPDVPAGTYLLEVLSPQYYFSQVKISVRPDAPEAKDQVLCLEYKYPGAPKLKMEHPLLLRAHSAYQYFEPRNRFGPLLAQLSSPMTWMLLLSVLVAFYMPRMMDGLTEEEKARLQEQSNPSALFQELLGGGGGAAGAGAGGARPAAARGAGGAGGGGGGGGARG